MSESNVTVKFINNAGGGFAREIVVPLGTTVDGLFEQQMDEGADRDSYKVRLNREICVGSRQLNDGDCIVMTPRKIEGA